MLFLQRQPSSTPTSHSHMITTHTPTGSNVEPVTARGPCLTKLLGFFNRNSAGVSSSRVNLVVARVLTARLPSMMFHSSVPVSRATLPIEVDQRASTGMRGMCRKCTHRHTAAYRDALSTITYMAPMPSYRTLSVNGNKRIVDRATPRPSSEWNAQDVT